MTNVCGISSGPAQSGSVHSDRCSAMANDGAVAVI